MRSFAILPKSEEAVNYFFKGFIVVLASSVTAAVTTYAYHKVLSGGVALDNIDYQDFVSISLTALGLMLTILGFFVAAASVIGWTTIENKLRDHSVTYFTEQLSKNGKLRGEFEEMIAAIAYEGVENFKAQSEQKDDGEEKEFND